MDIDPTILVKFGEKSCLKVSEKIEKIHAYILPWYSPMQIHMWPTQKKMEICISLNSSNPTSSVNLDIISFSCRHVQSYFFSWKFARLVSKVISTCKNLFQFFKTSKHQFYWFFKTQVPLHLGSTSYFQTTTKKQLAKQNDDTIKMEDFIRRCNCYFNYRGKYLR
jgi:hypothetical protein